MENSNEKDIDYKTELKDIVSKAIKESFIRSPNNLQRYIWSTYKKHIPIKIINDVMKNTSTFEIQNNKKIEYFKIVADIGYYQCDLTFYDQYSRKNKGYIGLLVVIEIPTRLVYIELIKNKKSDEIAYKFESILKRVKNKMTDITFDSGLEFINKKFEEVLNKWNIKPHYTKPGEKNNTSIVERMNRTIREKILTHFNNTNDVVYYKIIENHQLENAINNSYNRTIKSTPNNMNINKIEEQNEVIKKNNHEVFNKIDLKIGDNVRVRLKKGTFQKLGNKYSKTVHKITKIIDFHAYLDNDETKWWTLNQLKKVTNNININDDNEKYVETEKKKNKQKRFLKKEGLI